MESTLYKYVKILTKILGLIFIFLFIRRYYLDIPRTVIDDTFLFLFCVSRIAEYYLKKKIVKS